MTSTASPHDFSKGTFSMPAQMRLGAVQVRVSKLARSVEFYTHTLGLTQIQADPGRAVLAAQGGEALLVLSELADAQPKPTGTTGLYHFAILFAERRDLGRALIRLAQARYPLQGASDHLVSEALYLADPDGNGIELYWDRPRSQWPKAGGEVRMDTLPLDLDGLIAEGHQAQAWTSLPASTVMGHVHLHVGHMAQAEQFYRHTLGLDLMQRFGTSALFLSAGGYHHHVGANIWAGIDAPPTPHNAPGLDHWTIILPAQADLDAFTAHLRANAVPHKSAEHGVSLADPSANRVWVRAAG